MRPSQCHTRSSSEIWLTGRSPGSRSGSLAIPEGRREHVVAGQAVDDRRDALGDVVVELLLAVGPDPSLEGDPRCPGQAVCVPPAGPLAVGRPEPAEHCQGDHRTRATCHREPLPGRPRPDSVAAFSTLLPSAACQYTHQEDDEEDDADQEDLRAVCVRCYTTCWDLTKAGQQDVRLRWTGGVPTWRPPMAQARRHSPPR